MKVSLIVDNMNLPLLGANALDLLEIMNEFLSLDLHVLSLAFNRDLLDDETMIDFYRE
jgi:hypothetical protein